MSDIIEHVAKAMDACLDGPIEWETMHPRIKAIMIKQSRAAILSTIEWLKENVSDKARDAGSMVGDYPWDGKKPDRIFRAMLSQAVEEIGEGK